MPDRKNVVIYAEHGGSSKHSADGLIWRVVNSLMAVFFVLATLVNVNDEDWYLWMPIYGIPGILATVLVFKPQAASESVPWMKLAVVTLVFCVSYLFYQVVLLVQVIGGQIQNPLQHEEGREMAGLLIIITWITLFRFTSIGRQDVSPANKSLMNVLVLLAGTLAFVPIITWSLCFVADWHRKLGHCTGMF